MTGTFKKAADLAIVYQIIKRLTTPFEETEAFHLGIIDAEGNNLKSRSTLTPEQKAAYTRFDILIFNLKKLLSKLPGGDNRLKNFAVAAWLLKESEDHSVDAIADALSEASTIELAKPFQMFMEDGMAMGGGDSPQSNTTTSTGVAAQGAVVSKKAQKKWVRKNRVFTRKTV